MAAHCQCDTLVRQARCLAWDVAQIPDLSERSESWTQIQNPNPNLSETPRSEMPSPNLTTTTLVLWRHCQAVGRHHWDCTLKRDFQILHIPQSNTKNPNLFPVALRSRCPLLSMMMLPKNQSLLPLCCNGVRMLLLSTPFLNKNCVDLKGKNAR